MSDDIEEEEKEIVKKDTGIVKDPRYFYYIDKEGNICRKFKGSTKKKDIKNF